MTAGYYLGILIFVAAVMIYMYPPTLIIVFLGALALIFKTRLIAWALNWRDLIRNKCK